MPEAWPADGHAIWPSRERRADCLPRGIHSCRQASTAAHPASEPVADAPQRHKRGGAAIWGNRPRVCLCWDASSAWKMLFTYPHRGLLVSTAFRIGTQPKPHDRTSLYYHCEACRGAVQTAMRSDTEATGRQAVALVFFLVLNIQPSTKPKSTTTFRLARPEVDFGRRRKEKKKGGLSGLLGMTLSHSPWCFSFVARGHESLEASIEQPIASFRRSLGRASTAKRRGGPRFQLYHRSPPLCSQSRRPRPSHEI